MKIIIRSIIIFLLFGGLVTPTWGREMPLVTPELLERGEAVYKRECLMCHGLKGDGEGPGAFLLTPKPRNFVQALYKLRSTSSGEFPTDQDLFRTLTKGIPNSMMPSFKELSEEDLWALVAVVKRFGEIDQAPDAIQVPPEPPLTPARLAQGKKVYADLECAQCHGDNGQGDGPASLTLKTDDDSRIWPLDFTRDVFKGGKSGSDLYMRITTGMDGTPMPSYETEASPDEIWALVQYVQSFAK